MQRESGKRSALSKAKICSLSRCSPTLIFLLLNLLASTTSEAKEVKDFVFCSSAEKFEFAPFQPFLGPGMIYYSFTRPLLGSGGVIKSYYFSPDGTIIEGEIDKTASFSKSGSKVHAKDVAYSIAGQISIRLADLEIFPQGTNAKFFEADWWKKDVPGIEILSESKFRIRWSFPPNSLNIGGRLREILERITPDNRGAIWVAKIDGSFDDFVGVDGFRTTQRGSSVLLENSELKIELRTKHQPCENGDFYDFLHAKALGSNQYSIAESSDVNPTIGILNAERWALENRIFFSDILRQSAVNFSEKVKGIQVNSSHFSANETGFKREINWKVPALMVVPKEIPKSISIVRQKSSTKKAVVYEFYNEIDNNFKKYGITVKWEEQSHPFRFHSQDIGIFQLAATGNRQKWLEGSLKVLHLEGPLSKALGTLKSLENIRQNASSTIPIREEDLVAFNEASYAERSIVPLFRKRSAVMYKSNSKIKYLYRDRSYPQLIFLSE